MVPVAHKHEIRTIDSHTAGHPTRVIMSGVPTLEGRTAQEKCVWFEQHHDDVRKLLLHEPRGHSAMVGAVLFESDIAEHGAFFMGSYNYLPMCGHATIGLAATLDYLGKLKPDGQGQASFTLEVPAGVITVHARYEGDRLVGVEFENVPAYLAARRVPFSLSGENHECDIAYGGNWYSLVKASEVGVSLKPDGVQNALSIGSSIKKDINTRIKNGAIDGAVEPVHSVLFYDTQSDAAGIISRQLVVLASNKFDRSPCGTGSSARLAQLLEDREIKPGERVTMRNILDIDFAASAVPGPSPSSSAPTLYQPRIEGMAHVTGTHFFILGDNDPLQDGFLCA